MRRGIILVPLVLLLNTVAWGQASATPTPPPESNPRQGRASPINVDNARFARLRAMDLMIPKKRADDHPLLDPKKGIYRKATKEEIGGLAVPERLLIEHADFLRGADTGIVKLNAESSCVSDDNVVMASEKCMAFKIPGAGTAFSFRSETYRIPRLADVILFDGIIKTGGVFQQVLTVDMGDVAIENVSLNTLGMKYLVSVKPVQDSDEFIKFDREIADGIQADGFLYRKAQLVKKNATFALRSIAYRGTYMRSVQGIEYDELEFDKRRDVIVVFRVVDEDAKGNVTILWKRLVDVEAPKLKVRKWPFSSTHP